MNHDIDLETFSSTDIDCGSDRYAVDAEILLTAIAEGDDPDSPVLLWVHPRWRHVLPADEGADEMMKRAFTGDGLLWAHNNSFERSIVRRCGLRDLGFDPPAVERWRCSAALCRRAGWPAALGKAADAMRIEQKKDTRGKALIRLFCSPQTAGKKKGLRVLPSDKPAEFREFGEYCKQDVRTQKAVRHKLKAFEFKGRLLEGFIFDMRLNDRGFPVNRAALVNARRIIDECLSEAGSRFRELTGFEQTQRAKCQGWFAAKGIQMEDMRADTVAEALAEAEDPLSAVEETTVEALRLYSELNYAAAKKVHSMLDCMGPDSRVRNCLVFYGAGTGRWAGTLVQPQNFKKPSPWLHKDGKNTLIHAAYADICYGCDRAHIESVYGPAMEVVACVIRQFIQDPEGPMLDADYSSIESRIVAWLAGQEDKLQEFREGKDAYKTVAAIMFRVAYEEVTKAQRNAGKPPELGCGFGLGAKGFINYAQTLGQDVLVMMGHRLTEKDFLEKLAAVEQEELRDLWTKCVNAARRPGRSDEEVRLKATAAYHPQKAALLANDRPRKELLLAQEVVNAWRTKHAEIVKLWRACDDAARAAIESPGTEFKAGKKLSFVVTRSGGEDYLLMRLPSGRSLAYPRPRLHVEESGDRAGRTSIVFEGVHPKTKQWVMLRLYGGLLVENATQATAFDIMLNGALNAEKSGYEILMLIHDQALAADGPLEEFGRCLTSLPAWADGLPIAAVPERVPYYMKD